MRKVKGFTLIECIVALAILGIASLTMAQIYASVSLRNRDNHLVNTSLSNQMKYVEQAQGAEAVKFEFNDGNDDGEKDDTSTTKYPPHENNSITDGRNITITSGYKPDGTNNAVYSYGVDIVVLQSRDRNDKGSGDSAYVGETEDNYNLRYKYLLGH